MEGSISEMFKHIFLRIPDEVCVFFYSCESIQCKKRLNDDQRFIVKKQKMIPKINTRRYLFLISLILKHDCHR